jgi:hypothetical protein
MLSLLEYPDQLISVLIYELCEYCFENDDFIDSGFAGINTEIFASKGARL